MSTNQLLGVVCLGVGIWILVNAKSFGDVISDLIQDAQINDEINDALSSNFLNVCAGLLVGLGVLTFLIGFCGCCGAVKESTCLLKAYSTFLVILLLLQITIAILAGVYKDSVNDALKKALTTTLNKNYNGSLDKKSVAFDIMMVQFECCGISGPDDFKSQESKWYNSSTYSYDGKTYMPSDNDLKLFRPPTCCKFTKKDLSQLEKDNDRYKYLEDKACPVSENSNKVNNEGCLKIMKAKMEKFAIPLILIGVLISLIEIIGVIFACCLISAFNRDGAYQ